MTARKAPSKPVVKPRETVASVKAAHAKDLQTLAEHMKQVAEDHGLCETFWKEFNEVNSQLLTPIVLDRSEHLTIDVILTVTGKATRDGRYSIDEENEGRIYDAIAAGLKAAGFSLEASDITSVYSDG